MATHIRNPMQLVRNTSSKAAKRRIKEAVAAGKKPAARYIPKHRADGTFKVSKLNKYNARGRFIDDKWFASKAEADRYVQLLEMQAAGTIDQLETQIPYPCTVNGVLVTTYKADFRYRINPGRLGQRLLLEDVKGVVTPEYAIKRALVHALHPVEIIELNVPKRGNVSRYRFLTADQFTSVPKE